MILTPLTETFWMVVSITLVVHHCQLLRLHLHAITIFLVTIRFANANFLDLIDLITIVGYGASRFIMSSKVLKKVEHQQYHDVWELEDYFDPQNDERKFDIPCPPELFITNPQLIEK
jgi:hypothetical protein